MIKVKKDALQVTNDIDGLLHNDNRTSQNSTPSSSPSLISQRQLMREAHEENAQIRTAIFKELRKHEKGKCRAFLIHQLLSPSLSSLSFHPFV